MKKRRPLVHDPHALRICESIDFDFGRFRRAYGTQIGCVLRGLLYDAWVQEFLVRHPRGYVIELGAGLGTRFERIDNGLARWFDIDLPETIAIRRRGFATSPRRTLVGASVTTEEWATSLRRAVDGPCLFVSEGMLMYLTPEEVRTLLRRIADLFGPCEVLLDSISALVVRHQRMHDSMKHMMDAPFRWGIDDVRDLEQWDRRLSVREVATLPDIARRFSHRVPASFRLAGGLARRLVPSFAASYRLSRLVVGV